MDSNGTALNKTQEEQDEWGQPPNKERTCRICGCTDSKACEGGCGWLIMFDKVTSICTKCITDCVPECLNLLVEVILLTHQEEIDSGHHGDDESCVGKCSTCDLIKMARKIEAALKQ
jgi:hypothetical protein